MLRTLGASAIAVVLGGLALADATDGFRAFTTETARRIAVARSPVAMPQATLETDTGARLALADLRGKWLAVDFVYTRCATYCSAQGAAFAQVQRRLADAIRDGRVQLLSISFDPAHDAPAALAAYLQRSGDRGVGWVAARPVGGDTLVRLLTSFGITAIADGNGGFIHNDGVHIVDPQGRIVAIIDADDPNAIASALTSRLEAHAQHPA